MKLLSNDCKSYAWPGNIRELENCVNYLTCLQLDRPVEPNDLPLLGIEETAHADERPNGIGNGHANGHVTDANADRTRRPYNEAKRDVVDYFEREYIETSLHHNKGNIAKAARTSGKPRRVFFELMRKHGISAASYRPRPMAAGE